MTERLKDSAERAPQLKTVEAGGIRVYQSIAEATANAEPADRDDFFWAINNPNEADKVFDAAGTHFIFPGTVSEGDFVGLLLRSGKRFLADRVQPSELSGPGDRIVIKG